MNRNLLLLLFVFLSYTKSHAQPAVAWGSNITGQGFDETFDVALDTNRNVFICGQVEFTSHFDAFPLSTAGIHDIYLAKYSPNGQLLWAKREGGVGGDKAIAVGVDLAGNSYICGEYEEDFMFGSTHVTADAGNNLFVAKYDPNGNFEWVRTMQGRDETIRGFAIAVDEAGNVYAGGTFRDRARLNGTTLFTTRGSTDVIIIKFNTDGDYVWSKRIGDSDSDDIWGMTVKGDKLYVTGGFEGSTLVGSTTLNSYGDYDSYLAQYDTSGSLNWAKHGGSSGFDQGYDVTVNGNDEVIMTGDFTGNANFSGTHLVSMGNSDIFVVSYDAAGNFLWGKKYGGTGRDAGRGIVNDKFGNLYFTGDVEGVSVFDSIHITSFGDIDIFVAKTDATGNPVFVKDLGGPDNERGRSCAVDKFGNVFVNGEYWSHVNLDTISFNGNLLIDAFLARIGSYPVCNAVTQVVYPISCYNVCDGAATVSPSGIPPYSYSWTTASGQTADSVFNLCPGSYTVTVTDGFGCVVSSQVNLSNPAQLSAVTVNTVNASCGTCSDAYIDITPTGGTPPYTFAWSNGDTTEDLVNVLNGTYQLCITDSNGCNACSSIGVGPGAGVDELSFSNLVDVRCNADLLLLECKDASVLSFELRTLTGQLLVSEKFENMFAQIDMSSFAQGSYILAVMTKNGRAGKVVSRH